MQDTTRNPLFNPTSIFLVALSLSIGWGIRGNFGHESGAWIPGALAAIAVCLLSGREDWRRRVAYCALFGGLGLGFGGSISYMYPFSFTASNQLATTWYGFFTVFFVGCLWAGLGGAGVALALAMDRERLTRMFAPLCFVLGMLILHKFIEEPIEHWLSTAAAEGMDDRWSRHKSPLYWFDADWFSALMALFGVCLFDLWDRRFAKAHWLVVLAAGGAVAGDLVRQMLNATDLAGTVARTLVVPLGDANATNPATGKPFEADNFLTNWPQFFGDFPQHLGWGIGLLVGAGIYFVIYGRWRSDASLFLHLSLGWLIAFLIMPVLGTIPLQSYGGFRMTPPRSDDWAGILGVFVALSIYCLRNRLAPVAYAAAVTGIIGGIMFASAQVLRAMLILPGHPYRTEGGTPPEWAHWQSANWHSFLEQSHGFGHGIAIAIAIGLLWRRLPPQTDEPRVRRWTEVLSVGFVVFFMTYANLFKNVREWIGARTKAPAMMKAPLIESIEWSAMTWFNLAWIAAAVVFVLLMVLHTKRRLDVVPTTWLGKGQLIYVLLLWIMVIGNFERALGGFHEQRLITEWVIMMNASLATFLIVFLPGKPVTVDTEVPAQYGPILGRVWMRGLLAAAVLMSLYTGVIRMTYGDKTVFAPEHSHKRWGLEAAWRVKAIVKDARHP